MRQRLEELSLELSQIRHALLIYMNIYI
jgi:hypothetical protein